MAMVYFVLQSVHSGALPATTWANALLAKAGTTLTRIADVHVSGHKYCCRSI